MQTIRAVGSFALDQIVDARAELSLEMTLGKAAIESHVKGTREPEGKYPEEGNGF